MSLDDIATRVARTTWSTAAASSVALCLIAASAHAQAPANPTPAAPAVKPAEKKASNAKSKTAPQPDAAEPATDQAAAPKKRDPAEAQRQIDAGIKHLQANKAEQAVQTLSVAISSGGLPPQQMARALHARGSAYRKTGKPAQAISDLTSALWIKGGLVDADRQDALKQRADAYREAGLPDQSTGEEGGARTATRSGRTSTGAAPEPVATASLAPDQQPAQAPSTGGLFASLFGGLGKSAQPAQPAQTDRRATSPATDRQPTTSGWSSTATTAKQPAPAAPKVDTVAAARTKTAALAPSPVTAPAAEPAAAPNAGIHARIALVRSEQEAQAVIQKLKTGHSAALGNKAATLSQATFGGMGSFVQVRVGPYTSVAEADGFCKKLKGSGLDCVPVDR